MMKIWIAAQEKRDKAMAFYFGGGTIPQK